MRKLGELVKIAHTDGGHGESVKSMLGDADNRALYSTIWSEKIATSSVFISGPAGYQKLPEQAPEEPWVTQGSGTARASCTVGKWKSPDIGPVRLAREKATAKIISSLTVGRPFKIF
jgi:hypothetical protein